MKKILDRVVGTFSVTLLAVMFVMGIWQVFTRFVMNSPSTISEEFLRYALIWLTMIGGAYVYGQKKHLAIVFIARKFSGKSRLAVNILVEAIVIIFTVAILILGGITAFQNAMGQVSPSLRLPVEYLYLSLPVSGVLFLLYSLIDLTKIFNKKRQIIQD